MLSSLKHGGALQGGCMGSAAPLGVPSAARPSGFAVPCTPSTLSAEWHRRGGRSLRSAGPPYAGCCYGTLATPPGSASRPLCCRRAAPWRTTLSACRTGGGWPWEPRRLVVRFRARAQDTEKAPRCLCPSPCGSTHSAARELPELEVPKLNPRDRHATLEAKTQELLSWPVPVLLTRPLGEGGRGTRRRRRAA